MAIIKEVDLTVNDNLQQTEKNVASLKTQLRQAQAEVQTLSDKFGATSREATEAAKRAAVIADKIGDAKTLTDSFNPDAKFNALSRSLAGVAGGYTAVIGLTTSLGIENKAVEDGLLKVQAAMAFSQGLQQLGESLDAMKQFGAVVKSNTIVQRILNFVRGEGNAITVAGTGATVASTAATGAATVATGGLSTAMRVLRTAIISTGIGALVVLVGMLVGAMMDSAEATEEQEKAQARLNDEIARTTDLMKQEIVEVDSLTKARKLRAEIAGASEKELSKIDQQASDSRIEVLHKERDALLRLQQDKNISVEQSKEINKKLLENNRQVILELENQNFARLEAERDAANERRAEEKRAADKLAEDRKKALADRLEKERENRRQLLEELKAFNAKIFQAEEDEWQRNFDARVEKEAFLKEWLGQTATEKLNAEIEAGRKTLDAANATEKERLDFETEAIDRRLELEKVEADAVLKIKEDAAQREKEIEQAKFDHKMELAAMSVDGAIRFAEGLKGVAGKQTALAKTAVIIENAAGIANIITNTVAANAKAVAASPLTAGQPWVTVNTASGILGVAKSILATKKALQTMGGGGDASGGTSFNGVNASTAASTPPSFNIVGASQTNQLAQTISQQQNRPIQTFVVGSEVSNRQAMDRQIIRTASPFGM